MNKAEYLRIFNWRLWVQVNTKTYLMEDAPTSLKKCKSSEKLNIIEGTYATLHRPSKQLEVIQRTRDTRKIFTLGKMVKELMVYDRGNPEKIPILSCPLAPQPSDDCSWSSVFNIIFKISASIFQNSRSHWLARVNVKASENIEWGR